MSQRTIQGTPKLAEAIKRRRQELGLTIEDAASRAGVGTKTWCRYETGESIRHDKAKGICKALNWHALPSESDDDEIEFNLDEYKQNKAWSDGICDRFGEAAAISFIMGSEIMLDHLNEDLRELSQLPKGAHVGQLPVSMTKCLLPEQFLTRYDYEFLYCLKMTVIHLRVVAHLNNDFLAHSVMEELALFLIREEAAFLMECMQEEMESCGVSGIDIWQDWVFDLFDDMDIVTFLYSDIYVSSNHSYHFDHWLDDQFYMGPVGVED